MTRRLRSHEGISGVLLGRFPFRSQSRCSGTLAFQELNSGGNRSRATAFFVHGLLGAGRNWASFCRSLLSEFSKKSTSADWRMVLIDLRNHGRSSGISGFHPPHTIQNTARDLADLVRIQGWEWPDVIVGHSLGGKVAMDFAESCAHGRYGESATEPKQLWLLDSVPGKVNPDEHDGEVERVLSTLQNLPSLLPSRQWVVNHFLELGFSRTLSEWIGSSVRKSGEHLAWAFNLQGAIEMFHSYRETSYWPLLEHQPNSLEISVVRAEKSDRWSPHTIQQLETLAKKEKESDRGKLLLHVLPDSGHWVHVDNPEGLLHIMAPKIMAACIHNFETNPTQL